MIKMAKGRCFDILDSFKSDSAGMPNTSYVRTKELADSPTSKYRWFEDGYKLTTVSGRYRNRFHGLYKNSFSKQRNIFDETARISLNGPKRV